MLLPSVKTIFAYSTCALLFLSAPNLHAQERPLSQRVIQSGHSLTDSIIEPLQIMVTGAGGLDATIDNSSLPGSPMDYRWDHSEEFIQTDARYNIDRYDTLVLTERVSLSGTMPWHNSASVALRWFTHAWAQGNGGEGAETILYATWVSIDSGPQFENPWGDVDGNIPFRERLPREMAGWQEIQDHVNANRPNNAPPMRMIPGPRLMAAIYDEINAGRAPGLTHISDLFTDDIHLNDIGSYYIALAHFAVIYNRDPRGLQNQTGVSPALALWLQDLVVKVLSE